MRTARNHVVTTFQEHFNHRFSVFSNLLLVSFELRFHCFFECYRFTRDNMHQRTTLTTREYSRVQFFIQIFITAFRQDDTTAWTRQGFVGSGSHDVCMRNRAWINISSNQTCNVRHINEQVSTHAVSDFTHFCPVTNTRVSGETTHDHFWFVSFCQFSQFVVVDFTGCIDTVRNNIIQFTRQVYRRTVSQVTAVCQVHTQNGIAWLQQRSVYSEVSLRTRVRLHVSVVSTEQRFCTVDSQLLNDIHVLATAVVTFARIAFCILVSQLGALSLHYTWAGVVF